MRKGTLIVDLIILEIISIALVTYCFRGATSHCDGFMHLSKVKILLDNLRTHARFPRWNPYWYFGVPMWRIYSPLSYYIVAFLGWILHLSMIDIVMMWTYLAFSSISLSTYLLAREMGLKRLGCFISSVLFLSSYNLIGYWGIGSYPNVTGVAFSPFALLFFLRALKRRNLMNTLAAGLTFGVVILTYFMNAIILFVFIIVCSILMLIRDPSLLFVSREPQMLPEYTFVLPKILFKMILVSVGLSLWWLLPFLVTYNTALAIPKRMGTLGPIIERLIAISGVHPNLDSPGIGHFILAVLACAVLFIKRKVEIIDAPICFIVAFIFSLAPWLHIPTGLLYWWRFTLYLSLFGAICGGIIFDLANEFLKRKANSPLQRIFSIPIIILMLSASIYPTAASNPVFLGYNISQKPEYIQTLECYAKPGERMGLERGYGFNLFTKVPQSGGGNIHYVYMINEFAYTFWFYMFTEPKPSLLPYFSRNYNVRWFKEARVPGLKMVHPELYEVESFNSSFAEIIGPDSRIVLFIGEAPEYSRLFLTTALANPQDIILVYGGENLENYDLNVLRKFDVIYLNGLIYENPEELKLMSRLLSDYVESGGGVVLDTGIPSIGDEMEGMPDPFPISKTAIYSDSHLILNQTTEHAITKDIDLGEFKIAEPYSYSYAKEIKAGASVLVHDQGRPVVVYWEKGSGRVIWTGLRLPYLTVLHMGEEQAKFTVNILRFVSPSVKHKFTWSSAHFEYTCPEEIVVYVRNASIEDAIWVKMSYYQGWTAWIEDEEYNCLLYTSPSPRDRG